jgi:hypothetical protein
MVSKLDKFKLSAFAFLSFACSAVTPVQAHGFIVPPRVTLRFTSPFTPRVNKLSLLAASRTPGLSVTRGSFLNQARAIMQGGANAGINQSVLNSFQGQIKSGVINGTFYESANGSDPFVIYSPSSHIIAFGTQNQYSTNGFFPTSNNPIPVNSANQLSFLPVTTSSHGPITSGGPITSVRGVVLPYLSGSQRGYKNYVSQLASGSYAQGQKIGNSITSSPIVGGNFYGTDYYYTNGGPPPFTYQRHTIFDYAFGNSPLNLPYNPAQPLGGIGSTNLFGSPFLRNYIQLANGRTYTFSSGLLAGTVYYPYGQYQSNRLFSIGNDPLNFFNNFGSSPGSLSYMVNPTSYLFR